MRGPAQMFFSRKPTSDLASPLRRPFFTWHGITFIAGTDLWAEPKLRGTDAEAWAVMTAPTLFDLVELARRAPVARLRQINEALYVANEISVHRYERTLDVLDKISIALHQRAKPQNPGNSKE